MANQASVLPLLYRFSFSMYCGDYWTLYQCTMHNSQCTIHNAQFTIHNAQCTKYFSILNHHFSD